MKTQEEIKKLAEQYLQKHKDDFDNWKEMAHSKITYVDAYNQCQEDIVEELKKWIEITLSAESKLGTSDSVIETLLNVKYKIESLKKQD